MADNTLISIQRTSILNTINNIGNGLRLIGIKPFKLDLNKMISKAKKKANFQGKIPENVHEGMTVLFH